MEKKINSGLDEAIKIIDTEIERKEKYISGIDARIDELNKEIRQLDKEEKVETKSKKKLDLILGFIGCILVIGSLFGILGYGMTAFVIPLPVGIGLVAGVLIGRFVLGMKD